MSDGDSPLAGRVPAPVVAVAVVVGLVALAFVGGNALAVVLGLALSVAGVELTPRRAVVLSVLTLQLVAFTAVSVGYLRYRDRTLADIGLRVPSLEGWIALGAGYVGMVVVWLSGAIATFVIASRLGIERQQQGIIEVAQQDPLIFVLIGVLSLLIVGPAEELLFRGIVQSRLRETFGPVVGVGTATVLFAFAHITGFLPGDIGGALLGVVVLFLVGLVLGVVYEFTDNLVVVAIIHGLFNMTQAAFGYIGVRFGDAETAAIAVRGIAAVVGI
ncbi:CPBP family intramembrane glutamic endopeptidase [Natronomonas sp.]|uniref:CPBP family intramembrane glutamic endopeptidase n=1 Tax=Natronomonas sp. TaxID=2184060 RepID=UPI002FC2A887